MKFGLSSMIFGYDDIIQYLPVLKKYEIDQIELRGYPPRIPYNKEYHLKLKEELARNEIIVHSMHLQFNKLNIASFDSNKRKDSINEVIKSIEVCENIGCEIAILHPGGVYGEVLDKSRAEENSIDSIKQLLKECESRGIKLAVENMLKGRVGEDYGFFKKLFQKIQSPNIGICFDSSHANIADDVYDFLQKCDDKLFTVHLSDNFGNTDDHLFPFKGNINWERVKRILNDISYKSIFMLEVAAVQGLTQEDHLQEYKNNIQLLMNISA